MSYQKYINENLKEKVVKEKPWINCNLLMEHLEKSTIPNEKIEEWKYFNTSKILNEEWPIYDNSGKEKANSRIKYSKNSIILKNGILEKRKNGLEKLDGVNLYELSDYIISNPNLKNVIYNNPKKYSETRVSGKTDKNTTSLLSLNALLNKGIVIEIEENKIVSEKIDVFNLIDSNKFLINPYILIICKNGSSSHIVDTSKYLGDNNWINPCVEVYLDVGANLTFSSLQSQTSTNLSTSSINFHLLKQACLNMFLLNRENTKSDIRIFLKEKAAKAKVNGIILSNKKYQSDVFCKIEHLARNCSSQQNWRLLPADNSTASIKGKIVVKKNSKGSSGKFYSKSLILGEAASAYSKPELEIFEDEVSCSHGASFGEIDKNLIFYMQSRGICKTQAIKLIITAFINDIISDDKRLLEAYLYEMEDFFKVNLQ